MSAPPIACLLPGLNPADGPSAWLYQLTGIGPGCWIGLDDLEFRVQESLTADEVAQAFYVLTGGIPGAQETWGESQNYWLDYDPTRPGVLLLRPKQPGSHTPPVNPFSMQQHE